jgi:HSP20 family protein
MAARQDAQTPQEQTKQPTPQSKQAEPHAKSTERNRPNDTSMTPYRGGGAMSRSGGWEPFVRLRDEFDRLFEHFSRGLIGAPAAGWGLDVRETDKDVTVRAEAPGFEPADFDIRVHGDRLVMSASRKTEEHEEEGYRGWRRNEFAEAVMLPAEVDADKVKAAYRNGVLTVTLPKAGDGKSRRINVES